MPFFQLLLASYDVGKTFDSNGEIDWHLYDLIFDATGPLFAFNYYNLFTWKGYLLMKWDFVWYTLFFWLVWIEWIIILVKWILGEIDFYESTLKPMNWYDPNKRVRLGREVTGYIGGD